MLIANSQATHSSYPSHLQAILSIEKGNISREALQSWSLLDQAITPLVSLEGLSQALGLQSIHMKDESARSSLASFKVLGAPIALVQLIMRLWPEQPFNAQELLAGQYQHLLKDFVVISATDGNHGRALAAAAQSIGCKCVIVIHAHVSTEREQAIAQFGAEIIRIQGNYDQSVIEAAQLAEKNKWWVVSDTSYTNYEEVPRDVMQGYAIMAQESLEQHTEYQSESMPISCPYSHVFLQGGVGGLAAGVISHFWQVYGANRPFFISVEPNQADCILQSILHHLPTKTQGSGDSLMAGLACGEVSPLAWQFLKNTIDWALGIEDSAAEIAMRQLAQPIDHDKAIVSGESGAAGLAGLLEILKNPELAQLLQLNSGAKILLINSEGATAPSVYQQIVGLDAKSVLSKNQY